jgi:hypothetical protein
MIGTDRFRRRSDHAGSGWILLFDAFIPGCAAPWRESDHCDQGQGLEFDHEFRGETVRSFRASLVAGHLFDITGFPVKTQSMGFDHPNAISLASLMHARN